MSAKQADQIAIPLGGEFFVASTATAIPSTVADALLIKDGTTTGWTGLGWVTGDGATITQDKDVLDIPGWGSGGNPVKRKVTKRIFNFAGTLLQSNAMNVSTWFRSTDFAADGGTTTPGFRSDITIDVPNIERALLVIWELEGHTFALPFKKVDIGSDGDLKITDTDAQQYGLAISSLVPDTGSILGSILTDHPAFAPA